MKRKGLVLVAVLATALALMAGCGGEESSPREKGMQSTSEGSYQVRGIEDGVTSGVGIYDRGSFRLILGETSRMIVYNRESGEGWLVNLAQKTYEPISYDEAVLKAQFMPGTVMEPYFELEQFWNGAEFRMDTADGRSIKAYLEGPDYLPSAWEVEKQGQVFIRISWEYYRVGEVSPANFQVPEGFTSEDESQ